MTRSAEFAATIKRGIRVVQPDLVVHGRHEVASTEGPRVGFIVSKSVGNAVDRHRVARRLRHAAGAVLTDLDSADRLVIRALPSSRDAATPQLLREITAGVRRARARMGDGE